MCTSIDPSDIFSEERGELMWRRGLLVDREMHKEVRNHWEENSREGNVFTSIQMQPKELNEKIHAECLIEIWFLPLMDKWRLRKKYNERHIWKTPNQWVLIENVSEWVISITQFLFVDRIFHWYIHYIVWKELHYHCSP